MSRIDNDAPSRHPIVERFDARGRWTASTALHPGGDAAFESSADMALARDWAGRYYIPGSSIAGAARGFLARTGNSLHDYQNALEDSTLESLFGRGLRYRTSAEAYASLLTVSEARLSEPGPAFLRDGVKLDPKTGIAEDGGKFDLEVLPAGSSFDFHFELVLYDELPHRVLRQEILRTFRWLLECFQPHGVRLGRRTRRGLGQGGVDPHSWTIRRFDLRNRGHLLDWLQHSGSTGGDSWTLDQLSANPLPSIGDRLSILASFALRTPILIRAGAEEANAPDAVHFTEKGVAWITGSALAGALRHRVRRIAGTLWDGNEATQLVEAMFGFANEPQRRPKASRVGVTESRLDHGQLLVQSRVRIDRFTGGSLEAFLFDEAPYWPGESAEPHVGFHITLDAPSGESRRQIAVFVQAFKDLWLADLPIGGESGCGRGILEGREAIFEYRGVEPLRWRRTGDSDEVQLEGWSPFWRNLLEEGLHG